jgi:hypothetical protein
MTGLLIALVAVAAAWAAWGIGSAIGNRVYVPTVEDILKEDQK